MQCGAGENKITDMLQAVWWSMVSCTCLASVAFIQATNHRAAALSSPCLCAALAPSFT